MADFKCGSTGELIRELEAERDRLRKERDEWRELYESVDSKRDALSACVAELKQQLDAARGDLDKERLDCAVSEMKHQLAERELARLREGLERINNHPSISYPPDTTASSVADRQYQIGFTDGVRDCVKIVRDLLAPPPSPEGEEEPFDNPVTTEEQIEMEEELAPSPEGDCPDCGEGTRRKK